MAGGFALLAVTLAAAAALILPATSSQPDRWQVGYLSNGDYEIASVGTVVVTGVFAVARDDAPNVIITADGQVGLQSGAETDPLLRLRSRYPAAGSAYTGDGFSFDPLRNAWSLERFDANRAVVLLSGIQHLSAPVGGTRSYLQMTCSGSTIAAAVDGGQRGSV